MASTGSFSDHRNAHYRNPNAGTTRRYGGGEGGFGIGDAPPQKRFRSQLPLYHHHQHHNHHQGSSNNNNNNMSRVCSQSYNNYGVVDDDVIASSNSSFALRNDSSYQKPFVFGSNPNLALDALPEWNYPVPNTNVVQAPLFMNSSNMASIVSHSMSQPILLSKQLTDLLSVLNNNENENDKDTLTPEPSKTTGGELPPGLSFDNPSSLNVRHESVINSLYSDMPRQCSSCGLLRFKSQEEHSKHMDWHWHLRKNRTAKTAARPKSRGWLPSVSLWLSAAGMEQAAKPFFGEETQNVVEEQKLQVVPADEEQKNCALCEEAFEDFFSHEHDDWMYKDAVYYPKIGRIVHAKCMS